MARTANDIVNEIMRSGIHRCIMILDGKRFGGLLGELLKMLTVAEGKAEDFARANEELWGQQLEARKEIKRLRTLLETRIPAGLREKYCIENDLAGQQELNHGD